MMAMECKPCDWKTVARLRGFAFTVSLIVLLHGTLRIAEADDQSTRWLGPTELIALPCPDGPDRFLLLQYHAKRLVEFEPASVDAFDTAFDDAAMTLRTLDLPDCPNGIAVDRAANRAYIACGSFAGQIVVVDLADWSTECVIPVGHTPVSPVLSRDEETLYVANRFEGVIAQVDMASGNIVRHFPAGREPIAMALTPDGRTLVVANHIPDLRADHLFTYATVRLIDIESGHTDVIGLPNGAMNLQDVCISPDGRYAYTGHVMSNYESVASQVHAGWINTSTISVIDLRQRERLNTLVLDDLMHGAANPWAVACSLDGKLLVVTHAGSDEVSLIDRPALHKKLDAGALPSLVMGASPNNPGILQDVRRRVSLPVKGVRHLAMTDRAVYVVGYFSDSVAIIPTDVDADPPITTGDDPYGYAYRHGDRVFNESIRTVRLGPNLDSDTSAAGQRRRGELLFHDATICYQHWHSCASCHPDGRADALNWDLQNDGVGNPKNTKSLLLSHRTPPSMVSGVRATAEIGVRAGLHHILFAKESEPDALAIDEYLKAITPVASPHLVADKCGTPQLSESAKRGKHLFSGPMTGCATCHPGPLYTDLKLHNVNSQTYRDQRKEFDTPTLIETWRTAPYLHDGQYMIVKELLTTGQHGNASGRLDRLTEDELNDLVQFVLSL